MHMDVASTGNVPDMSENHAHSTADRTSVWKVVADPSSYQQWVVGAKAVRGADPDWPAPGSSLHHTSGAGPVAIKDRTTVIEADPGRRVRLRARLRPLGVAEVTIDLRDAEDGGTDLVVEEHFVEGLPAVVPPLSNLLLRGRNTATARRLGRLAEGR